MKNKTKTPTLDGSELPSGMFRRAGWDIWRSIHSFVDFGIHITINALLLFTLIVIAVQSDRLANANAGVPATAGTLGE